MKKCFCVLLVFTTIISISFSQDEVVLDIDDLFIHQYDNQNDSRLNKYSGKINLENTKDLKGFTGDSIFIEYAYLFDFCKYADIRFSYKTEMLSRANDIQSFFYQLYYHDIQISKGRIHIMEINGEIHRITCRYELKDLSSVNKIDLSIIDMQIDWSLPVKAALQSNLHSQIDDFYILSESYMIKYINDPEMYKLVKVIQAWIGPRPYRMQFDVSSGKCIQFIDVTNH